MGDMPTTVPKDEPSSSAQAHYVLRFGKALTQDPLRLQTDEIPLWITLGYFDTLQIYPLPHCENGDWIRATCLEDRRISTHLDGHFYFHPVHITACAGEVPATFFAQDAPYLAVTFVQGQPLHQRKEMPLQHRMAQVLQEHNMGKRLSWAYFHTLNLSDLVILWKSNSLHDILYAIELLYRLPCVGDLRSVPAILRSTLMQEVGAPEIQEETIPLVLTRYLVQHAEYADQYFQYVSQYRQETPFLTTGMEDLSTVSKDTSTTQLLAGLRARLLDEKVRYAFQKAFQESEIHLGIQVEGKYKRAKRDQRLVVRCEALHKRFLGLRDRLMAAANDATDGDWIKVAEELYNALTDMSRSTVSDGFCYLILESAQLFCREMETVLLPDSAQIRYIQRFLRGWGTLMEQSMRQDGKFSQQPGYSPALCQIPASLLELYLAFNARCCQVLQRLAADLSHFCFLLVPKLCRRIKVEVIIQKLPPCDRLLYVDIPYDLLYEPAQILPHLCHEISHFCGEDWRMRSVRKACFIKVCAFELAQELRLYHQAAYDWIYRELSDRQEGFSPYLNPLLKNMIEAVHDILENQEKMDELFRTNREGWENSSDGEPDYQQNSYAQFMKTLAAQKNLLFLLGQSSEDPGGAFFNNMREFRDLFRECYADISMIFLLGLSYEQYLGLNQKEIALFERNQAQYSDYALTVERWAIVNYVVFSSHTYWLLTQQSDPSIQPFALDVAHCMRYFFYTDFAYSHELEDGMKMFHRQQSIYFLTDYLRRCFTTMQSSSRQDASCLVELREAFRSMSEKQDPFGEACQSLVRMYRKELLTRDIF